MTLQAPLRVLWTERVGVLTGPFHGHDRYRFSAWVPLLAAKTRIDIMERAAFVLIPCNLER
jgi:hypothetical protein